MLKSQPLYWVPNWMSEFWVKQERNSFIYLSCKGECWGSLPLKTDLGRFDEEFYNKQGVDFPSGSEGKASAYNVGYPDSTPVLVRSPGEGNGNSLQYSCLENPMNRGTWQPTVHGVPKSWTRMSNFSLTPTTMVQRWGCWQDEGVFRVSSLMNFSSPLISPQVVSWLLLSWFCESHSVLSDCL